MRLLNLLVGTLVDGLLWPFRGLPPLAGLTVVSLLTAIGMLLVFKATSDQPGLEAVKRRIHACLFEIRLFNDDLRAILRAQLEILRHNLRYFRLSLVPLVWILPPLVLVVAQLQAHYGYRGLEPGQAVLLSVELEKAPADSPRPAVAVELPAGLELETPGVWIPSRGELTWRLAAERRGDFELAVEIGGQRFQKRVRASERAVRRSPRRHLGGFVDQLLYPSEPPLPADGPVKAIRVAYPEDPVVAFMPRWMWIYFLLAVVFAFVLRRRFGVTI